VREGLRASICAQPDLLLPPLVAARCIDAARLSNVAGVPIQTETKGNRPGCLCARALDVGVYDTCPHGCIYCYAVRRPEIAKRRYQTHDPSHQMLVPPAKSETAKGRLPQGR